MHSDNSTKQAWLIAVLFLLNLVTIRYQSIFDLLSFDRELILNGQLWRLVSGHFIHQETTHFLMNMFAIVPAIIVFRLYKGFAPIKLLIYLSIMISLALLIYTPDVNRYCGLSALSNSLILICIYTVWLSTRQKWILLFLTAYVVKLLTENISQQTILLATEWPALPSAHLFGALAAIVFISMSLSKPVIGKYLKRSSDP